MAAVRQKMLSGLHGTCQARGMRQNNFTMASQRLLIFKVHIFTLPSEARLRRVATPLSPALCAA